MENLNFENFFGSSVAIHDSKAVSCAYREMPKDENFTGMESNMGENIYIFFLSFFHFDGCTSSILDHIENRINHGCLTHSVLRLDATQKKSIDRKLFKFKKFSIK